jgi:hypothetical protein
MKKFRDDRRLKLLNIEDTEVKRIVKALDEIHDGKKIIQVNDVIAPRK